MRKKLLVFGLCWVSAPILAQELQWANQLVEFSSQVSQKVQSAKQVLGPPNSLPQGGNTAVSWAPGKDNNEQFIKVKFDNPVKARQIIVVESFNPGAVRQVIAYDLEGVEHIIGTFVPQLSDSPTRLLSVPINEPFMVAAVKLLLSGKDVAGKNCIDAIGISDSSSPVLASINLSQDMNPQEIAQPLSINSEYNEFGPLVSVDGRTLYFSRRYHPQNVGGKKDKEDIWYAEYDSLKNDWGPAKNISSPLNNESYNFVSSLTPDGNTLVLGNVYGPDDVMEEGVSISSRTSTGWTSPKKLEIANDYNRSDRVNYFMGSNKKVLLISAQRDDTFGGRDLYASFLDSADRWTEPVNLGSSINTAGEEYAPFLAPDDRTLYFSSSGFPGYGGDDIYLVRRLGEGWQEWTLPENVGPVINTPQDDAYFTLPASGLYAYFTSNKIDRQNQDIYRINIPKSQRPRPVVVMKGRVLSKKTMEPVSSKIIYENLKTGKEIGTAQSNYKTGEYRIVLPTGAHYGFQAQAKGFISVSSNQDLTHLEEYKEMEQDLYLEPEEVGASIALNNVFFDTNKFKLKPESHLELNRFLTYLEENPGFEIEVAGHTDNVGNSKVNQQLSFNRASVVAKYLVSKGLAKARLQVKGYGKNKPISSNATEFGRSQNRRVEFILKKE
jgi:outer membrane protein OmpA-like peptidoglycan-associated protein